MSKKIYGIEIRNIEFEDGEYATQYVDVEDIAYSLPDAPVETIDDVFKAACNYLENFVNGVVSCEEAKINQVYN